MQHSLEVSKINFAEELAKNKEAIVKLKQWYTTYFKDDFNVFLKAPIMLNLGKYILFLESLDIVIIVTTYYYGVVIIDFDNLPEIIRKDIADDPSLAILNFEEFKISKPITEMYKLAILKALDSFSKYLTL